MQYFKTFNPDFCCLCGKPKIVLVQLTDRRTLTETETQICTNKNCPLFIDQEKIKTWIAKDTKRYKRDFRTQNRIGYNPRLSRRRYK